VNATTYGTDDGFRRAMADANRMRLRSLGVATCATALVVALTGTLVPAQQSSGEHRLDVVTTPVTPRPSSTASPEADPSVPPGTATQALPASGTVSRAPHAARREPAREATASRPVRRGPQSTGMSRTTTGLVPNVGCAIQTSGWCFQASGVMAEQPAHTRRLAVDLCGAGGENRLQFDTSAEVELTVVDSRGRVLWSWLADHPPARQPHTVTYATGTSCLRWTAKWYERTNAGVPLRPGRYKLVARLLSRAPGGVPASSVEFRL
jgi:hypothetical protein